MSEDLNGKVVNSIVVGVGESGILIKNTAEKENGYGLIYESVYMGDHSEDWVIQISVKESKEIARYNTRFISEIKWLL
jgi:hypothetical protein